MRSWLSSAAFIAFSIAAALAKTEAARQVSQAVLIWLWASARMRSASSRSPGIVLVRAMWRMLWEIGWFGGAVIAAVAVGAFALLVIGLGIINAIW